MKVMLYKRQYCNNLPEENIVFLNHGIGAQDVIDRWNKESRKHWHYEILSIYKVGVPVRIDHNANSGIRTINHLQEA